MNITRTDIFKGCLIASIAHAIMTNVYPDFSYEQSWDGLNYSIQDTAGMRGTITFTPDFCVGAIRNDNNSNPVVGMEKIQGIMNGFPEKVVRTAQDEALQYLLLEVGMDTVPCVTSVFWADETGFYYDNKIADAIKTDLALFEIMLLPREKAIAECEQYYDMNPESVKLLRILFQEKARDFASKIILNQEQKELIPGRFINSECAESLGELNIFVKPFRNKHSLIYGISKRKVR